MLGSEKIFGIFNFFGQLRMLMKRGLWNMKTRLAHLALFLMVFALFPLAAGAENPGAAKRKAHADLNKDGTVGPREMKMEKKWEKDQKARVNKKWEAKADTDKDGVVERGEARAFFRKKSVVDRPWEAKADANNDGRLDLKELHLYHKKEMDKDGNGVVTPDERSAYWNSVRAVVNTKLEKRFDKNGDGYLSWDEGKEMLKYRHQIAITKGRAVVNNDVEVEFDANNDGIIDKTEAPALLNALK
jgi:Ca2+-binding EF-hand superfamily protein